MNILVCVKQVPDTTEIKIDPVTNTLIRQGVPSILNPFDGYALEAAARIKDADPSVNISVVCMGPPQAKDVLVECLAIAADKAYLVTDRIFGGSDTLATSYILSCAVEYLEKTNGAKFDLIFCGKQAIDGDTAQVGPELAEILGRTQVTYGLSASMNGGAVRVEKEVDGGVEILEAQCPALVTFTQPHQTEEEAQAHPIPRFPTIKRKMAAKKAEIPNVTAAELSMIDATRIGLKGSPTKVKKTFVPQRKTGGIKIQEAEAADSAKKLFSLLSDAKII